MSSDYAELPAASSDDELPRATENLKPSTLDLTHPQEVSRSMPDDYTTADIPTLLHRLYALASQI